MVLGVMCKYPACASARVNPIPVCVSARVSPVQFVQVFVPVQSVTTLNEWLCVCMQCTN